ncbi:hypothetical protein Tco_0228035 [Tanacetum coccineum]
MSGSVCLLATLAEPITFSLLRRHLTENRLTQCQRSLLKDSGAESSEGNALMTISTQSPSVMLVLVRGYDQQSSLLASGERAFSSSIGAGRERIEFSSILRIFFLIFHDLCSRESSKSFEQTEFVFFLLCYNRLGVRMDSDISDRFRLDFVCHSPHVFFSSPSVELC